MDCVLITGAAGRIGRALRRGLHGRVGTLRLLDVAPLGAPRPGEELLTVDIRDLDAVAAAMDAAKAKHKRAARFMDQRCVRPNEEWHRATHNA